MTFALILTLLNNIYEQANKNKRYYAKIKITFHVIMSNSSTELYHLLDIKIFEA